MNIGPNTRLFGLFGHPLGHSLSPALHNAAFERCGIDAVYLALPVPPERLESAIDGMRAFRLGGANVTIPYKQAVIPFLDGLSDSAAILGAVNTLYWEGDRLLGDNTDAPAFADSLHGFDPKNKSALILGAGGAAKAVVYALLSLGLKKITIASRRPDPGTFSEHEKAFPAALQFLALEAKALESALGSCDLVVNATPLGMDPKLDESPLSEGQIASLREGTLVYDLIYNPPRTLLLSRASERGLPICNGAEMLARQAALAFRRWTGFERPDCFGGFGDFDDKR